MSGFSHDLLTCVTSSSFSQPALGHGWDSGMWGEAGNIGLHLLTATFPFPGLAGPVPAGQEFLLPLLPWLWLTEAMDSRCSSAQQCWKAVLADGHQSLLQFHLMNTPVTGGSR